MVPIRQPTTCISVPISFKAIPPVNDAIENTGPGIAPQDQGRIFEDFQQVDNTSTRYKGGTGLGLAIARRLVAMHGGQLELTSALGHGSRFTFKLKAFAEEVD